MDRRTFIKSAGVASAITGLGLTGINLQGKIQQVAHSNNKKLKILFLGGTNYIGPVIINELLQHGHSVTLFNRGSTQQELFPSLEKVIDNRIPTIDKGLSALNNNKKWDVIIDTWQGSPLGVRDSCELLKDRCNQYIYISTIAVYGRINFTTVEGLTENHSIPQQTLPDTYDVKQSYGTRKRSSEQVAKSILGNKLTILRPHSICGYSLDKESDNQRYWPIRLQRGGEIVAPGDGLDTTQYTDVIDLSRFVAHTINNSLYGTFNTFATDNMYAFLYGLKAISSLSSQLHFLDYQFLKRQNISSFTDMPMWVPRQRIPGFFSISNQKAIDHGYRIRPLAESFKTVVEGFNPLECVST